MKDHKGTEIELDQIVQHEDLTTGEVSYFHVQTRSFSYLWLMKLDEKGNTHEKGFGNVKIDSGVGLSSDNESRWTILGSKKEIFNQIFK